MRVPRQEGFRPKVIAHSFGHSLAEPDSVVFREREREREQILPSSSLVTLASELF